MCGLPTRKERLFADSYKEGEAVRGFLQGGGGSLISYTVVYNNNKIKI